MTSSLVEQGKELASNVVSVFSDRKHLSVQRPRIVLPLVMVQWKTGSNKTVHAGIVIEPTPAQHGRNIRPIERAFGVPGWGGTQYTQEEPELLGAQLRKINVIPIIIAEYDQNGWFTILYNDGTGSVVPQYELPENPVEGKIYGCYDNNSFMLASYMEENCILESFRKSFQRKDILLCLAEDGVHLQIQMLSRLSETEIKNMLSWDRQFVEDTKNYLENLKRIDGKNVTNRRTESGEISVIRPVVIPDMSEKAA